MENRRIPLPALLSVALVFSLVLPASVLNVTSVMAQENVTPMVAAGGRHMVGLKVDGTVVAVGYNEEGECNVGGWGNITQVAAGSGHTVGLKTGGTVVAAGDNHYGECDVGSWTDIIQVAAGTSHTVGLKSDGTVVAVGDSGWGECYVGNWTDIVQVAAGQGHTAGLKADGTVVTSINISSWQWWDVGGWTGIIQVAEGAGHTVGLKSDGTVVAVGINDEGQCDVGGWTDITQVAAGGKHTVGLKNDGTVVSVGLNVSGQRNVGSWTDIIQVAAGGHTVGLKSDGTVVATGFDSESELAKWNLWNLEPVVPPSDIENVTWGLESYEETKESGHVTAFLCSAINATFEGGRVSGYAGCNKYWGDYELKGNNLSITGLIRTEMSCGEFIGKIEQAYLTALRDAESYEIEGGKLRVNCGNRLLVFNEGYSGTEMWHRWWPMEWLPWAIIAAAVVAGGLVIFFVRRRRHA